MADGGLVLVEVKSERKGNSLRGNHQFQKDFSNEAV